MSLLDGLTIEDYCEHQGLDYKVTNGANTQVNIRDCPFCGNSKFKVYVSQDTNVGICFSCNESFNLWKFIEAASNSENKREMVKHISEVKKDLGYGMKPTWVEKHVPVYSDDVILPDSIPLPTEEGYNAKYLEERGVNGYYAKYFHFRYCASGAYRFTNDKGEKRFTVFDGRIIIPIYDIDGRLANFQGRDATGLSERRYLFPSGLAGTGTLLYNGHNALGQKATHVLINEGVFDVVASKIIIDKHPEVFGDTVPIGTFGKHLSDSLNSDKSSQFDRLLTLRKYGLQAVTIMWDGEEKALEQALEAGRNIKEKLNLKVFIALLPPDKDPAECTEQEYLHAYKNKVELTTANFLKLKFKNPYKITTVAIQ